MSRWALLALCLLPGGLVVAPILLAARRLRERNRVRQMRRPVRVLDLTGMTGIERDAERCS